MGVPVNRWGGAFLALALASGCAWGPGMRMDEGSLEDRAEAAGGPDAGFALYDLTPEVVARAQADNTLTLAPEDPLGGLATSYQYRVAPYDVLSVIVWDHPELTIPAGQFRDADQTGHLVMPDGSMFYPHAGVVQVAGKTLPEIREMLTTRLTRVLEKPQLDVRVAAFRGYRVNVTGEVKTPTMVPITDIPLRALDAINTAQGTTELADMSRVVLTRNGKTHLLNLQAANELGILSQNWILTDGDVLHVPDRSLNKVYVLGEVKQPSSRYMEKGRMTLADAIGDSEGLDQTAANAAGIYVIRGGYDRPQVYRLDATSPDAMLLAAHFPLKPLDVVFVSTHKLTQWNRIMTQLWPTINAITQPAFYLRGLIPITTTAQ